MKCIWLLWILGSCAASSTDSTHTGDTIKVKLDARFEVKLPAVMASGFSWSIGDSAYMKYAVLDTTYTVNNPTNQEGDPETQVFQFIATQKGKTSLRFIHVRPWRKQDPPTKEKNYTLIVE